MKLLILLVIVLAIIAIAQLTKVYDLSKNLRKSKEEEISDSDNKLNANLMLIWMFVFFLGTIFLYVRYGNYLPEAASVHGKEVDWLMSINLWGITIAFFIVNAALFYVAWKFYYKKGRKVKFMLHDNKLEMIWTLIPGVSMAFIIIFGLITWNHITGPASPDAIKVELYSEQFKWTARYPGGDKEFGASNYNLIDAETGNALGLVDKEAVALKVNSIDKAVDSIQSIISNNAKNPVFPESYVETLNDKVYRMQRQKQRILDLREYGTPSGVSEWQAGKDDKIVKGEFHIPVGQEVEFVFRSQDVIHSAYMPHFRAQMNAVPGVPTRFKMTPTITTKEMRQKLNNDAFNYILLCNKVCGAAHYNMKMEVVVETQEEYDAWLGKQKSFKGEPSDKKDVATVDVVSEKDVKVGLN